MESTETTCEYKIGCWSRSPSTIHQKPRSGPRKQVLTCRSIIAPPYTVTPEDVEFIVLGVSRLVEDYFSQGDITN